MGTTLAIIGDSLTERGSTTPAPPTRETATRAAMVAVGYADEDIYWYGRGGKTIHSADSNGKTAAQNVADARTSLGDVNHWVIALGTNNSADVNTTFQSRMNALLNVIYPTGNEPDRVWWVNLAAMNPANTNYNRLNPVIASTAAAHPAASRITVLDWYSYIHSVGVYDADDWLPSDIPHMTVQGSTKRDEFIAQAVALLGRVEATVISMAILDEELNEVPVEITQPDDVEIVSVSMLVRSGDVNEPPDPEPDPETWPLMGVYLGNHNENPVGNHLAATGVYPDISTQYYQAQSIQGGTINTAAENAKLALGIIPLITVTSINGPWTHAQVASGAADSWINYWASSIAALNDGEIWMTFDHEFEVKLNQSKFSWTPSLADYIGAFNRWQSIIKAARPSVKWLYWYGYSDTAKINTIGAGIDAPDMIGLDPYVFIHHAPTTTFEQMAEPKLDWLRGRSWYDDQPIVLCEYGKDTGHGDAELEAFYTNLRPRMQALGLYGAVQWCRNQTPQTGVTTIQNNILTVETFPLAKAAYAASAAATPPE